MNTTPLTNNKRKNFGSSMFAIFTVSLGLLMSAPVSASAQELFSLSTENGLELYQVEKLVKPNCLGNTLHSAGHSRTSTGSFRDLALHSTSGTIGEPLFVQSGLQTTPNGRLTMANRIDWEPTVEDKGIEDGLMASLIQRQPQR
jgi:hypothetical protein